MTERPEQGNAPFGLASVPAWVRVTLAVTVAVLFLLALAMLIVSVLDESRNGWAVPAVAFVETAGTGLMVLLLLFFVDRSRRPAALDDLTRRFFELELPTALSKMAYVEPDAVDWTPDIKLSAAPLVSRVKLKVAHAGGAYKASYLIEVDGGLVRMSAELNIRRVGIVYVMEGHSDETPRAAFDDLRDTFSGAQDAHWHLGVPIELTGRAEGRGGGARLGAQLCATAAPQPRA